MSDSRRLVVRYWILALAVATGACTKGETPEESLQRLGTAFAAKDRPEVERYLDIHRTVESAVDQIIAGVTAALVDSTGAPRPPTGTGSALGLESFGGAFAVAVLNAMKPTLTSYFESAVSRAIAGDSLPPPGPPVPGNLLGGPPLDPKQFARQSRGVKNVQVLEDVALVDVEFRDDSSGRTLVPQLQMERRKRYWQLVGFTNLADVVEDVATQARGSAR
jgi:hypothetical protein